MKGEFSVINSLVHSWPVLNYYYYYHYYNLQGLRSDTGIAIPSTPASVPGIGFDRERELQPVDGAGLKAITLISGSVAIAGKS